VNDVHEIVALVEDLVDFGGTFCELPLQASEHYVADDLRMRLITNLEHVFAVNDLVEAR